MTELCNPPLCILPIGHAGDCRNHRSLEVCGAWMPKARESCARTVGHREHHSTRYALDNNREAYWRRRVTA